MEEEGNCINQQSKHFSMVEEEVMKTKALLANVASKAFVCVNNELFYSKPVDV